MNGLLISAGGQYDNGTVLNSVHRFDPYALISATPRKWAAMTASEGRVFLCGGDDSNEVDLASVEVYDPQADEWGGAADLPSARYSSTAVTQRLRLFVIGGVTDDGALDEIVRYDQPQDRWDVVARMSTARDGLSSAADGDTAVYLVGGVDTTNSTVAIVERFDTATNEVSLLPPLPEPRSLCGVMVLDGVLYMFGGYDINDEQSDAVFTLNLREAGSHWIRSESSLPEPCSIQLALPRAQ